MTETVVTTLPMIHALTVLGTMQLAWNAQAACRQPHARKTTMGVAETRRIVMARQVATLPTAAMMGVTMEEMMTPVKTLTEVVAPTTMEATRMTKTKMEAVKVVEATITFHQMVGPSQ